MEIYKFKCKNCGASEYEKVDEHTYKCKYCGCKEEVLNEKKTENGGKTQIFTNEIKGKCKEALENKKFINFLICFFFGVWGVHRFMNGKIFTGLIFLCTYGIFGIGWFIDTLKALIELIDKKEIKNGK